MTTTREHDSQIAPSPIERNIDEVEGHFGDGRDDDRKIPALAREGYHPRSRLSNPHSPPTNGPISQPTVTTLANTTSHHGGTNPRS